MLADRVAVAVTYQNSQFVLRQTAALSVGAKVVPCHLFCHVLDFRNVGFSTFRINLNNRSIVGLVRKVARGASFGDQNMVFRAVFLRKPSTILGASRGPL